MEQETLVNKNFETRCISVRRTVRLTRSGNRRIGRLVPSLASSVEPSLRMSESKRPTRTGMFSVIDPSQCVTTGSLERRNPGKTQETGVFGTHIVLLTTKCGDSRPYQTTNRYLLTLPPLLTYPPTDNLFILGCLRRTLSSKVKKM